MSTDTQVIVIVSISIISIRIMLNIKIIIIMGIVIIAAIVEKHRKCTIRKFRKLISLGNSTPILWKLVSADSNNEQFIHEYKCDTVVSS